MTAPNTPAQKRPSIGLPLIVMGLVFLTLLLVPALVRLVTDWIWFREAGYGVVFTRELTARWGFGAVAFAIAFGVLYGSLRFAQRGIVLDPVVVRLDQFAPRGDLTGVLKRLTLPAALLFAFTSAATVASQWSTLLAWFNAESFGVADPVFGRDVGYYVFTIPALQVLLAFLSGVATLALLTTAAVYWVRGDVVVGQRGIRIEPSAGRHLGILIAAMFLFMALTTWFVRIPGLLESQAGRFTGATYADLAARLPAMRLLAVLALAAAAFVIWGAMRGRVLWHATLSAVAYVVVTLLGTALIPAMVQRFVVDPNELARERPQLENHIKLSRIAWGIDDVEIRDLSGEATLTIADINRNGPTLENVRLWDREPLLQTLGQLQEIRTYYDFVEVDDDRYMVNGRYRQIMTSPRELNPTALPTRNFINERLTFTHGMGVTLSPVNEMTAEGLPVLFVKDLPPTSSISLAVTRPQIYYGELGDHWVVAPTQQREFDYPEGEQNVFTHYEGSGGAPIGNGLTRLLFAMRFGDLNLLLNDAIGDNSRIMFRRNVRSRVAAVLPTLLLDGDPYMVVREDGTLTWLLDAYTRSRHYPYSVALNDGTRYMRNSVKVSVDAYNGTITAYVADETDPIIRTNSRMFPGIFKPISEMPTDLRSHARYPEDIYRVQTELYTAYHMDDAEEFYAREDQWQIPRMDQGDATRAFMRHIIMRLPDEDAAEYIFMTPYTPRGKDNLAAWMVARMDGENYGQLRVYRFPKQSLVYGPRQVVNRINQNTDIARQISLWDQRGSEVIRGELLVIPIEESLLYVQPLYLRAQGGRIPELKRVIAAYQNRVVMDLTLDRAIDRLFDPTAATVAVEPMDAELGVAEAAPSVVQPAVPPVAPQPASITGSAAEVAQQANAAYEAAIEAQRRGDWARYGQEIERLGQLLRRLRNQ
ncbi:MAG TPA: UPF0182 family protein [Gemmatimonadales bacterium]|nr:UPF0182 family protein [Gemmatimonadales bacterium]